MVLTHQPSVSLAVAPGSIIPALEPSACLAVHGNAGVLLLQSLEGLSTRSWQTANVFWSLFHSVIP